LRVGVPHRRIALGLGKDSAEQHAAEALEVRQHYGDPALVAVMAREAPAALDWMVSEGGPRPREAIHRQGRGAFRMHLADKALTLRRFRGTADTAQFSARGRTDVNDPDRTRRAARRQVRSTDQPTQASRPGAGLRKIG
jgi:succinate dehydrogenase/fumarate reductase flavoprotein subunit